MLDSAARGKDLSESSPSKRENTFLLVGLENCTPMIQMKQVVTQMKLNICAVQVQQGRTQLVRGQVVSMLAVW